jgi:hypothetical protein
MTARSPQSNATQPSTLLIKLRPIFLVGWSVVNAGQAWLQAQLLCRHGNSGHHLSVIAPAGVIAGCTLLAIWGLYNLVYLTSPTSRLYLFRWMST